MQTNSNEIIRKTISERFGVGFLVDRRKENGSLKYTLQPLNLPTNEGFKILVQVGWKRLFINFEPENMAGLLLFSMGNSAILNKEIFCSISSTIVAKHGEMSLVINGKLVNINSPTDWPLQWQNLEIKLKSPIFNFDGDLEQQDNLEGYVIEWLTQFFSALFPLLPLVEEEDKVENNIEGLPEGASTLLLVNRYERSKLNRQVCISYFGAKCKICGFDFGTKYGEIGRGYIEVHHITPVSEMGTNYKVNPVKDLIPVCSNCHSIIHKHTPAYTIDEMREIIKPREISMNLS